MNRNAGSGNDWLPMMDIWINLDSIGNLDHLLLTSTVIKTQTLRSNKPKVVDFDSGLLTGDWQLLTVLGLDILKSFDLRHFFYSRFFDS